MKTSFSLLNRNMLHQSTRLFSYMAILFGKKIAHRSDRVCAKNVFTWRSSVCFAKPNKIYNLQVFFGSGQKLLELRQHIRPLREHCGIALLDGQNWLLSIVAYPGMQVEVRTDSLMAYSVIGM